MSGYKHAWVFNNPAELLEGAYTAEDSPRPGFKAEFALFDLPRGTTLFYHLLWDGRSVVTETIPLGTASPEEKVRQILDGELSRLIEIIHDYHVQQTMKFLR